MPVIISYYSQLPRKGATNIVSSVLNMGTFRDADDEKAKENVPQIKGQLFPQMCADERGLCAVLRLVAVGIDTKTGLFVDVGFTHRDGNGEDGNVHHDY